MNDLEEIRNSMAITNNRAGEPVEFSMAKAYRGVAYLDAHENTPAQSNEDKHLSYRGVAHVHPSLTECGFEGEPRRFTYRGQNYER